MAQEHRPEKSILDLRQEIAHSRDRLGLDLSGLGYELNFPLKFKKSFQRRSKVWAAGAALIGLILSIRGSGRTKQLRIERGESKRKGEEQKKGLLGAGLMMGAFRLAATLLRPMVVSYVTKRVGSYAGRVR